MKLFSIDRQQKIRGFLERSGILFPKGKRSGQERRMNTGMGDMSLDDYLAMEGSERQNHFVMRSSVDRRDEVAMSRPLDGML